MSNNNSNKESSNNIKNIYYQNKSKKILLNKLKLPSKDFTLNNLTKEIKKSLPQNIELLKKFKYYTTINGKNYKFNSNLKLPISIISSETLTIIPDLYEIEKNNAFISNKNYDNRTNNKNNVELLGNYLKEYLENKKKSKNTNPQFLDLINDMIKGIKSGRNINSYPLLVRLFNTYMKGESIMGMLYKIEKEFNNKLDYLKKSSSSLSVHNKSTSNKIISPRKPIIREQLKEYINKKKNNKI